jgi:tRNA threonylcarbamoyladenosine biosynthesis protein TsaE
VVGHAYDGRDGPLAHLDLYRLAGSHDEDPGLLDPFFAPGAIAFVEWPESAAGAWSDHERRVAARVRLSHLGADRRGIEVTR